MISIDFSSQVSFPLWSRELEILERSELESFFYPDSATLVETKPKEKILC